MPEMSKNENCIYYWEATVELNLSFYIPTEVFESAGPSNIIQYQAWEIILRTEWYQNLLIICQYQATHYLQGSPSWGSFKFFLYSGSHISTIPFSPKRKGTFSRKWILTTVELRCRIIFFLNVVMFAWSSFSFKLNIFY